MSPVGAPLRELALHVRDGYRRSQRLYPGVDAEDHLTGVVTRSELQKHIQQARGEGEGAALTELVRPNPVRAYPDEPLPAGPGLPGMTLAPGWRRNRPARSPSDMLPPASAVPT